MWGQLILDITFQTNYWFGFPESNSDIILNLTHWQYWWWFWFTYLLCLYYFIFLKLIRSRLLKFSPKIVTSYRAHGKWGDFIICLLPVSWCVNILSNSNFILRMLEWQTESSLFTVRIRGKQWYWIYKFEIKNLININQIPKNIGHNYWVVYNNTNLNYNEDYINILQLKNNNEWLNSYTTQLIEKKNYVHITIENNNHTQLYYKNNTKLNIIPENIINNKITNSNNFTYNSSLQFLFDTNRYYRYNYFNAKNYLNINILNNKILLNFNSSNNINVEKNLTEKMYLVIKQKRYLPTKTLNFKNTNPINLYELKYKKLLNKFYISNIFNNSNLLLPNVINKFDIDMWYWLKFKYQITKFNLKKSFILNNTNQFNLLNIDSNIIKNLYKTNKNKSINFNNIYNKRLLRTKRILVLPTNINITLITNSFDVVHSWYIPGLGIKMDCIPGRSTHHTLYIDHAGFYYGQCAEICGRHHHHMPIRLCALPFEHFLIWWYHYGLPYFTAVKNTRKKSVISNIRQYNW